MTREQAINYLRSSGFSEEQIQEIVKALEQEPVLDKIRSEIEQDAFKDVNGSKYIFVNRVNQILDKYKGEVRKRNEF